MYVLNLTHSPENRKDWESADRFYTRAGHAQDYDTGEKLAAPRGLRQHRAKQGQWSNPGMQK